MEKYILITVSDHDYCEIEVSYHDTHESAYKQMENELDQTGKREDNPETEDTKYYDLSENSAWSDMNRDCKCNWLIQKLPFEVKESE